jgi:predicted dehydrogenase
VWALGRVTVEGRSFRREDINRRPPEELGLIAGDSIDGMFAFPNGLTGYFASRKNDDVSGRRFGIRIYGSRGIIAIQAAHVPAVFHADSPTWTEVPWTRLSFPEGIRPMSQQDAYHLMIDDLLEAIEADREPVSGGRNARWTIEMAMAVYASARTGARVAFPLKQRTHPLES